MRSSLSGNPCILHDSQNYDLRAGEVSSGTTIMALSTGDAVVLGADSRVSTGTYIANRVSDKIAQLSEHIYCCRSGSAADTQWLTDIVKHFLQQLWYAQQYILVLLKHKNDERRTNGALSIYRVCLALQPLLTHTRLCFFSFLQHSNGTTSASQVCGTLDATLVLSIQGQNISRRHCGRLGSRRWWISLLDPRRW